MPEKNYWFQTKSTGQNIEICWSDLLDLSHATAKPTSPAFFGILLSNESTQNAVFFILTFILHRFPHLSISLKLSYIRSADTGTGISRICESRESSSTSLLFHTFKTNFRCYMSKFSIESFMVD